MTQENPLHGLVTVLWSMESFKKGLYPLHVETLGDTIKKNIQFNVKPNPKTDDYVRDWHIIGVFTNHDQALRFSGEFAQSMGIVAWSDES